MMGGAAEQNRMRTAAATPVRMVQLETCILACGCSDRIIKEHISDGLGNCVHGFKPASFLRVILELNPNQV